MTIQESLSLLTLALTRANTVRESAEYTAAPAELARALDEARTIAIMAKVSAACVDAEVGDIVEQWALALCEINRAAVIEATTELHCACSAITGAA